MTASEQKRFNDLESWISAGHRNGHPLSEEDYEKLEAERDQMIQEHGHQAANRARSRATSESYTRPAGAEPRKPRNGGHTEGRKRRGGSGHSPSQHSRPRVAPNRRRRASSPRAGAGSSSGSYGGGIGDSLWSDTGLSSSAGGISQLLMKTLGLIIGLSLVYLLLSKGGSRAFSSATSTSSHILNALISPKTDPLRGTSTTTARTAAARPPAPAVGGGVQAILQQAHVPGNSVLAPPRNPLTLKPTTSTTLVH